MIRGAVLLGRVAATVLALAAGCDANTPVAILPGPVVPQFCDGDGPAIIVGDGITVGEADNSDDDVCTGTIARRTFRFALCLCEDYITANQVSTDSFSASEGPYDAATAGARGSLGVNGDVQFAGPVTVRGSMWAGNVGAQVKNLLSVSGDLMHQGGIAGAGSVAVGNDATVAGSIALDGTLTVGGQLIMPPGSTVSAAPPVPPVTPGSPPISDPCACASEELVDINGFIESNKDQNDNQLIGLSPSALAGFNGPTVRELPCGRYYLDTIDGNVGAELTLKILGRVVIFVGGDVNLKGPLHVVLADDPKAEVDLFVHGLLQSEGPIEFGDPTRPSKARLYVGGSGEINLSGSSVLAGNLYAPLAHLALSADVELFGSLFLAGLRQSAPVILHYDEDVQDADVGCPNPTDACRTCLDCNGQACNGGTCGACQVNEDCCAPLVCDAMTGMCIQH